MTFQNGVDHKCLKEECQLTNVDGSDRIDIILPFKFRQKKCDVERQLFLHDVHSKRLQPINSLSRYCHSTNIVPFIDVRRRSITCTEKIESTRLNSDCQLQSVDSVKP